MSNVINKSLKNQDLKVDGKRRDMVLIAVGIAIMAVVVYFVYSHIEQPDTYAELEPMMEEAREFEMQAAEYGGVYESIEDQIGEDAYFAAIEEDYVDSTKHQREIINMIEETDKKIQAAGGITNYEELQRVKIPATDRAAAIAVAEQFGTEISDEAAQDVPLQKPLILTAHNHDDHANHDDHDDHTGHDHHE